MASCVSEDICERLRTGREWGVRCEVLCSYCLVAVGQSLYTQQLHLHTTTRWRGRGRLVVESIAPSFSVLQYIRQLPASQMNNAVNLAGSALQCYNVMRGEIVQSTHYTPSRHLDDRVNPEMTRICTLNNLLL